MTVILFGQLKEIAGIGILHIDHVHDTNELRSRLQSLYPQMAQMKYAIAINKKVVSTNTTIPHNSSVALLPPFSGG